MACRCSTREVYTAPPLSHSRTCCHTDVSAVTHSCLLSHTRACCHTLVPAVTHKPTYERCMLIRNYLPKRVTDLKVRVLGLLIWRKEEEATAIISINLQQEQQFQQLGQLQQQLLKLRHEFSPPTTAIVQSWGARDIRSRFGGILTNLIVFPPPTQTPGRLGSQSQPPLLPSLPSCKAFPPAQPSLLHGLLHQNLEARKSKLKVLG
ncbi:hypothetical protein FHG87_010176 [Trinorchestia longiramus]|nr:hypothetical protein FHG87_010176 [Trinorchestia longiramus]